MARTTLVAQDIGRAESAVLTFTAGTAVTFDQVLWHPDLVIVLRNTGAGSNTPTIQSVADNLGREGDYAVALAAAAIRYYDLPREGFKQADGMVYIDVDSAEVEIAAFLRARDQ